MEILEYKVDDKTIAELLGVQNFTTKESAVLELVKNAYDAGSKNLEISVLENVLIIEDDGIGMNENDIKNFWMYVGKSCKGYKTKNNRVLAGSKGIGRFALARLGREVEVFSKKENSNGVCWKTNWEKSLLEKFDKEKNGTKLVIKNLREKWNKRSIELLGNYLSRSYNDNTMEIVIRSNEIEYYVNECYSNPKLGYNCLAKVMLKYNPENTILNCLIESDEFLDDAYKFCKNIDINYHQINVNMYDELQKKFSSYYDYAPEEIENYLNDLGEFSAELCFKLNIQTKEETEKFLYKHKKLADDLQEGITLYRNAFSISSFDGSKDWLELGKRNRKSPAAATHPTGAWRVRENNLYGKIMIDKENNKYLKDLSNRQGIDENIYYKLFVEIILHGISEFERYRQKIIRDINKKNKIASSEEKNEPKILDLIKKNHKVINKFSEKESKELSDILKRAEKEERKKEKEFIEKEKKYKYDVRILNALATSGLKSTSIAHELKNDRNHVKNFYKFMKYSMEQYEIWDYVNEEERTRESHTNIPYLLEKNSKINEKIVVFLNSILESVEKNKFYLRENKISEIIKSIVENWKRDYSKLDFQIKIEEDLIYEISEDIIKVILDNLILNSVQQNSEKTTLKIEIKIKVNSEGKLEIVYKDFGKGLDKKYLENPEKILEVHETSRDDGHGLGMWIINNSILMCSGEVKNIIGTDGFEIFFTLGRGV